MTKNNSTRTGPSRVAVAARVNPVASAVCVGPVPSCSVPFCPAPTTLCNNKANKAEKVLERDKECVGPVPFRSVPSRPGHYVYP